MNLQRQTNFSVSSVGVPIRNTADYSPFGVALDGRTVSMDFYRRGFNGMEKDDEVKSGGNSYTTEFRQYDARVGRWLSLDPKFQKRTWINPYNFVQNNPLLRIDKNGQLDDIYTVDNDGNVTREKKTDQDYDMLYSKNDWDSKNYNNGIKIEDTGILKQLLPTSITLSKAVKVSDGNPSNILKVFKFLSDNTNKEWSVTQGNVKGIPVTRLATDYNTGSVTHPLSLGFDKGSISISIHSHPDINKKNEKRSMGVMDNGQADGDWANLIRENPDSKENRSFLHYVYFPNTGHLFNITFQNGPKFIKTVKDYTDFIYKKR